MKSSRRLGRSVRREVELWRVSYLLPDSARILPQISLQGNYTAVIMYVLEAPMSKSNRKARASFGRDQLFLMLTLSESCHGAALCTRGWKNYLFSLLPQKNLIMARLGQKAYKRCDFTIWTYLRGHKGDLLYQKEANEASKQTVMNHPYHKVQWSSAQLHTNSGVYHKGVGAILRS